jgi:hypothetical protein
MKDRRVAYDDYRVAIAACVDKNVKCLLNQTSFLMNPAQSVYRELELLVRRLLEPAHLT